MQICLEFSAGLAQTAGIGRYPRELALALNRVAGIRLLLFHNRQPPDRLPPALATLPRSQAPLSNKAWRFYLLSGLPLLPAWRSAIDSSDLFHGADSVAPRLALPTVITIHDFDHASYFQSITAELNRLYLRWALPIMTRRANRIIADSYSTQYDIVAQDSDVAPSKVTVVSFLGFFVGDDPIRPSCHDRQRPAQVESVQLGCDTL